MTSKHEIFFSYAWDEENGQSESGERIVNELYHSLLNDNFRVIRDKYNLKYKGLISDFITGIGRGSFIVVAISDKYLKSPYCMFELYEIARNSNLDKKKFTEKILPVMAECIDFTNPGTIEYYFSFWENKQKVWENLVRDHSKNLSGEQLQRYHNVKVIFQNFGMLTEWITDMNTSNLQILSEGSFADIKREIRMRSVELNALHIAPGDRRAISPAFWIGMVTVIAIVLLFGFWLREWGSFPTMDATALNKKNSPILNVVDTSNGNVRDPRIKKPGSSSTPPKNVYPPEPRGSDVSPPLEKPKQPMCLVICDTRGVGGVEVSFFDEKSNTRYEKRSDSNDLEFEVPCYLKEDYVLVTFKRENEPPESRRLSLKTFEIPERFTTKKINN